MRHTAIFNLYTNVVTVDDGTGAFDQDGNQIEIDETRVAEKVIELQEQATVKNQAREAVRQSALNKLSALGLTEEEINVLVGR